MVKGTKGTKVKVFFQWLHMTHVIFVLVHNLKFCILDISFNITCYIWTCFDYKLNLYHIYYVFMPPIT
jgi:hypothetical protein